MPAPSGHGQRNKGHNTGRHSSKSTRNKHKVAGSDGTGHRKTIKVRLSHLPGAASQGSTSNGGLSFRRRTTQ